MSIVKYEVEYLGGHPKLAHTGKAYLKVNETGKEVQLSPRGLLSPVQRVNIHKENIIDISTEKMSSRSAGKTAAGALIGGVLTGGVGLIVGGALGARKKNKTELYLTINYNEKSFNVILKTGKDTDRIYSEIVSLFA